MGQPYYCFDALTNKWRPYEDEPQDRVPSSRFSSEAVNLGLAPVTTSAVSSVGGQASGFVSYNMGHLFTQQSSDAVRLTPNPWGKENGTDLEWVPKGYFNFPGINIRHCHFEMIGQDHKLQEYARYRDVAYLCVFLGEGCVDLGLSWILRAPRSQWTAKRLTILNGHVKVEEKPFLCNTEYRALGKDDLEGVMKPGGTFLFSGSFDNYERKWSHKDRQEGLITRLMIYAFMYCPRSARGGRTPEETKDSRCD